MSSEVYWRVLISHRNNKPTVVCMQDFDEYDYDQKRFVTETKFETEELAEDWILDHMSEIAEAVDMASKVGFTPMAAMRRKREREAV